ncbi:MAG: hypothetical protein ABL973_08260 [Micropepsaceae bacterium]
MAQNVPSHLATLRFSTLLLSCTSLVAFSNSAALADPVQPYWVIPAVLSDPGINSAASRNEPITLYRPALKRQFDLNLYLKPSSDFQYPRLSSLEFSNDASAPGLLAKFSSSTVQLQPSVSAKVSHIAEGLDFASGGLTAQTYSLSSQFLDGRVNFSSDIIDDSVNLDRRDFRDPQLRETARDVRTQDLTRRHRFAAKLIDSGKLRLMVDGEFGHISDQFALNFSELPTGQMVLPGSWSNVSSRLEFGDANVTVGYQDYETRNEARKREQVVLGFAKSELQVYRRQGSEFNLINGGQWLKRTTYSGITADLMVADVLPSAVADAIDPVRFILPTSVSGGFERGDVVRAEFTTGPRDKVTTANMAMTWDTRLGETTASFWQRKITTDLITPGVEDGVKLSQSSDRYADISHSVRRGNWKFGAGLSLIQTNDEVLGVRNSDSQTAPHVSIAYEPEHGPKVELRFGAADAQSQIVDDNLAARAKTRQLQLSVDVSDYVRDELNRPDAKLKLEYRYDFSNGSDNAGNGLRERDGGHALLVTFSTPLN